MKTILYFISIFILMSCNAIKQKDKIVNKDSSTTSSSVDSHNTSKNQSNYKITSKDSTAFKSDLNVSSDFQNAIQNLTLKSNGKCSEVGETTFMEFKDQQGNTLKVPVNNNTELAFGNESNSVQENVRLNQELSAVNQELHNVKLNLYNEQKTSTQLKTEISNLESQLKIKVQKPVWYAFLFWCVIAVIVWEFGLFYLKKIL